MKIFIDPFLNLLMVVHYILQNNVKKSSPFKIRDKLQRNKMNSELFRDLRIKFCRFLHGIAENREPSPSSWNICIMYLEWNCSVRNLEKISLGMNKLRNASRDVYRGGDYWDWAPWISEIYCFQSVFRLQRVMRIPM